MRLIRAAFVTHNMYYQTYLILELQLPIIVVKTIEECQPSDGEALEIVRRMVLCEFEEDDIIIGPVLDKCLFLTIPEPASTFVVYRKRNRLKWMSLFCQYDYSEVKFTISNSKKYESMTLWMKDIKEHLSTNQPVQGSKRIKLCA